LTHRMLPMMVLAALIASLSGFIGLFLSYYAGIASGAAIVLVATAIFFLVYLFAPRHGLIWGFIGR
jgi:ABC-type Mn2+/Zn2+ transport system permease subunit